MELNHAFLAIGPVGSTSSLALLGGGIDSLWYYLPPHGSSVPDDPTYLQSLKTQEFSDNGSILAARPEKPEHHEAPLRDPAVDIRWCLSWAVYPTGFRLSGFRLMPGVTKSPGHCRAISPHARRQGLSLSTDKSCAIQDSNLLLLLGRQTCCR